MTIFLVDETPPVLINLPPDTLVECGADTSYTALGRPDAIDNCDTMPTVILIGDQIVGNVCDTQTVFRFWRVTDDCGNGSTADTSFHIQVIQIIDTTPPDFICPEDTEISCGDQLPQYEIE